MISLKQSLISLTLLTSLGLASSALAGNGMGGAPRGLMLGAALATDGNGCTQKYGQDSNTCVYNFTNIIQNLDLPAPINPESVKVFAEAFTTDSPSTACWYAYGPNGTGSETLPGGRDVGVSKGFLGTFDSPDSGKCTGSNLKIEFHTGTPNYDNDAFFVPLVVSTVGDTVGGHVYVSVDTLPEMTIVDNKLVVSTKGTLKVSGFGSGH